MKIAGRNATDFCRRPPDDALGVLIFGADPSQVADSRRALVASVMGADVDPLRLEERQAADLRRDPADLDVLLKERSFVPGRRIVLVSGGTDTIAKNISLVLETTTQDDALLIVTADALPTRSNLRKLFESGRSLFALHLFADAPEAHDIAKLLAQAGVTASVDPDALTLLRDYALGLDHGSFRQLIELVALRHLHSADPVTAEGVQSILPALPDAEIDGLVEVVALGRADQIKGILSRLAMSGTSPVTILIALERHFRTLLRAQADENGIEAGLDRIRPPLWRNQKTALRQQARHWTGQRVEAANRLLFDADKRIRSSSRAPDFAVLERCLLRLAMMAAR